MNTNSKKHYILLLVCFIIASDLLAINYYVSNSGNDSNSGISPESPIRTIAHLNTLLFNLQQGDKVLFKCGDLFIGTVRIPSGIKGTKTSPILFGSYGIGNKPVIQGSISVSNWLNVGGNIWKSTLTYEGVYHVFRDTSMLKCARIPNSGYYRMDATNGNIGFYDEELENEENYWKGATILFHLNEYWWKEAEIDTSSTDGYIGFEFSADDSELVSNSGYFIQNKPELLDTLDEWYYSPENKELFVYSNRNPDDLNIKASVYQNGIEVIWPWDIEFITIKNIEFCEQGRNGIQLRGFEGLKVENCYVHNVGQHGLMMSSDYVTHSVNDTISYNTFKNCMANGIYTFNISNSAFVHNNISNSGLYPVTGEATQAAGQSGMRFYFSNNLYVAYNKIDSSGNCGIDIEGENCLFEKNIVDNSMLLLTDGAAFYGYYGTNNTIRKNIFRNTVGNTDAGLKEAKRYTKEMYFDSKGEHSSIIEDNTIICGPNTVGIGFTPGCKNAVIKGNTIYNAYRGLEVANWNQGVNPIENLSISKNIIFSNHINGRPYFVQAWDGLSSVYSMCDSNYLFNPYSDYIVMHVNVNDTLDMTIEEWRTASNSDYNTVSNSFNWIFPNDSSFILVNESDSLKSYYFDEGIVDLDYNPIQTLTLAPFTSKVLLRSSMHTGIQESYVHNSILKIYPNPANDILNIIFDPDLETNHIDIIDITGKVQLSIPIKDKVSKLNTSSFYNGVYVVRAGRYINRLIIQH